MSKFRALLLAILALGFASYGLAGIENLSPGSTTESSANDASTLVLRDASGNFSAGTISASLNGTVDGVDVAAHSVDSAVGIHSSDDANTVSTLVHRDASGNFSAGTVMVTGFGVNTDDPQRTVEIASGTGMAFTGSNNGEAKITISNGGVTQSAIRLDNANKIEWRGAANTTVQSEIFVDNSNDLTLAHPTAGGLKIWNQSSGAVDAWFEGQKVGFAGQLAPQAGIHLSSSNMIIDGGGTLAVNGADPVSLSTWTASYTGGSAYVCVDDAGVLFVSEAACP